MACPASMTGGRRRRTLRSYVKLKRGRKSVRRTRRVRKTKSTRKRRRTR